MVALPFFVGDAECIYLPTWDVLPYDRTSPNPAIVTERLEALMHIMQPAKKPRIIITTVAAFAKLLPPKAELKDHVWQLNTGGALDWKSLATGW